MTDSETADRLAAIERKAKILKELTDERLECAKKAMAIVVKGPSKYPKVTTRRMWQVIGIAMQARIIQSQIQMVQATPITPGRPVGTIGNRVSGKSVAETVLSKDFINKLPKT